jgi:hypothetical protein
MSAFTKFAAVGVGLVMVAAVPGAAQAVDAYPPGVTPLSCSAKAVSSSSKIKVNVGPNQPGSRYYKIRLDVKRSGQWFRYLKTYKTQGSSETRTINVPKGTYRAKCYGKYGFTDATSNTVKIKK